MRLLATLGLVALAIVLFSPGASAHAAQTDVTADRPVSTQQAFDDLACIPVCDVVTTPVGNAPPVTIVENGSTVAWTAVGSHTATSDDPVEDKDDAIVFGRAPYSVVEPCLDARPNSVSGSEVTFEIRDGHLEAFNPGKVNPTWKVCEEAIELLGGSFALSYHCNNHPRFQNSLLVVIPSS